MDTEQALLQAIHDSPDDESTWLVLADWLEESGQPRRGEFLRLQRQLRGMAEGPARRRLEDRAQQLLRGSVRPCVPTRFNSLGMELALIPAGAFWLGSPNSERGRFDDEGPRRLITITRPFYLGVYPVTQDVYRRVVGANPSAHAATGRLADRVAGLDTHCFPVEDVTWNDAVAFCQRLGALAAEKKARRVYRLPSEAEWEYACRGGVSLLAAFPYGRSITNELCNFKDLSRRKDRKPNLNRTCAVGSYPPNGFGLYDMVGNVWQWCADWYDDHTYRRNSECDPRGPDNGERRHVRGGTFHLDRRRVRSADRSSFVPDYRDSDCGLRVVCEWRPG